MRPLTQIQWNAIESAKNEGGVEPQTMARLLLLDHAKLSRELSALVEVGLMEEQGGRFTLTGEGRAALKERDLRESERTKRAVRSWQPR